MKCPKCGALVGKKKKHKRWHKRTERLDWTGPMGPQGPPGPVGMAGRDAPGAITGQVSYMEYEDGTRVPLAIPDPNPVTKQYVEES